MTPNIQPYESQVLPGQMADVRASDASLGQGLHALGAGVEEAAKGYDDYEARTQASDAANGVQALKAQMQDKIITQQSAYDPYDPEAHEKFLQDYADGIEKLKEKTTNARAREYLEKTSAVNFDRLSSMAAEKNAQLSGKEAADQLHQFSDLTANNAYKTAMGGGALNPEEALRAADKDIQDHIGELQSKTHLTDAAAQSLAYQAKRNSYFQAAQGAIQYGLANPSAMPKVKADIAAGKYTVYADDQEKLNEKVHSAIGMQKSQLQLDYQNQVLQNHVDENNAVTTYYHQVADGDLPGAIVALNHDSKISNPAKAEAVQQLARLSKITDKAPGLAAYNDLTRRIMLPPTDPDAVTDLSQVNANMADLQVAGKYKPLVAFFQSIQNGKGTPDEAQYKAVTTMAQKLWAADPQQPAKMADLTEQMHKAITAAGNDPAQKKAIFQSFQQAVMHGIPSMQDQTNFSLQKMGWAPPVPAGTPGAAPVAAQPLAPATTQGPPPAPLRPGFVRMLDPSGARKQIPVGNKDAALKAGWKLNGS